MFVYCLMFFFFFKQKTAYEMRISDWSSDVCSSDLDLRALQLDRCDIDHRQRVVTQCFGGLGDHVAIGRSDHQGGAGLLWAQQSYRVLGQLAVLAEHDGVDDRLVIEEPQRRAPQVGPPVMRSEEHKSELQSLMR